MDTPTWYQVVEAQTTTQRQAGHDGPPGPAHRPGRFAHVYPRRTVGAHHLGTAPGRLGAHPLPVPGRILLVCAYGLGRLGTRIGLAPLVGELTAGVLLGPTVLGHVLPGVATRLFPPDVSHAHLLNVFCQFGILLLVAITGAQCAGR